MTTNALLFGPPTMDSLGSKAATIKVQIKTNPLLPAVINVDGQLYKAPITLTLLPGPHQFSAISNVPDPNTPYITYAFQCWMLNNGCVSMASSTIITLIADSTVTVQYMLGESGWGAPARPDSLPNPNGPMTPNLVLNNTYPK